MAEKPEDLNLPTAVVSRLIKEVLPEGINISKEARAAICKSASVFVLYATSCANNLAVKHKRKTLTAKDVLDAVDEMEFETFLEPLKEGLEAFKKEQKGKKDAAELKRKQKVEAAEKKEISEKKKKDSPEATDDNSEEPLNGVEEIIPPIIEAEESTEASNAPEEKSTED